MDRFLLEVGDFVRVKPEFWPRDVDAALAGYRAYGTVEVRDVYPEGVQGQGNAPFYLIQHEGKEGVLRQWWSGTCLLRETPLEVLSRAAQ